MDSDHGSADSYGQKIALAFQSEFNKNKIDTKIIEFDKAIATDLPDMAGLVIIPDLLQTLDDTYHPDHPNVSYLEPLPGNITNKSKTFLKKAFLLAKKSGKYLIAAASEVQSNSKDKVPQTGAFFAAISFLGSTFGFGDQKILDPVQGGIAGLVKTAAIEWKGVLCRSIDMQPFSEQITEDIQTATALILTRPVVDYNPTTVIQDTNFSSNPDNNLNMDPLDLNTYYKLYNGVEIGIKNGFYIVPELIRQPVVASDLFSPEDAKEEENSLFAAINSDDVIIITGGARGVTAECAIELALHCSPTIILMGRSPLPETEPLWMKNLVSEPEIKKAILANLFQGHPPTPMELQKVCKKMLANREIIRNLDTIGFAGSTVQYYSLDVRDMSDVSVALQDIRNNFGKISAIVHGAGILEDKFIIDKTEQQFSSVFDTKINGMENLINATINDNLKCVVFFSSVAARTGNAGQVDYAMANEVLNKTAQYYSQLQKHTRPKRLCRFLSINWGPWEGGMVSSSLKAAFVKRGIELIPLKLGAQSFVEELFFPTKNSSESSEVEVVLGASLMADPTGSEEFYDNSDSTRGKNRTDKLNEKKTDPPVLFSREKILAFAIGKPSEAFGEKYSPFDTERQIARLPGPPYFFMDRVVKADARAWEMAPGGWIECQFDMPCDGWYFRAAHTNYLPFCILLEIALQPCGWLAAYAGSALKSKDRLFFRNLGGEAQLFEPVNRLKTAIVNRSQSDEAKVQHVDSEHKTEIIFEQKKSKTTTSSPTKFITLTMRSRMTSVSHAGGLIIQNFDMEVLREENYIYKGKTNFGFFTEQSLSNQTGIKNSELHYIPSDDQIRQYSNDEVRNNDTITPAFPYRIQDHHPIIPDDINEDVDVNRTGGMPSKAIRMIDSIDLLLPEGGKYKKGFIKGSKNVNPEEWFFKAHFYQDPVCPGSLGVESFLQIINFYALKTLKYDPTKYELVMAPHTHKWIYRGQITPSNKKIEVYVHIKDMIDLSNIDVHPQNSRITADGLLYVDGLCIYQMEDFSMILKKK